MVSICCLLHRKCTVLFCDVLINLVSTVRDITSTTMESLSVSNTVEPLYNGHFGTSHFLVIFSVI